MIEDELDHLILMHRDVHFGGSFAIMRDFYKEEHRGCLQDIDLDRIEYLMQMEHDANFNLSEEFLTESEKAEVKKCHDAYIHLRQHPSAFTNLILSDEDDPKEEIAAIVKKGDDAVPTLLTLLQQPELFNPLYPGYGQTPHYIVRCLEEIGDTSAIKPLFEAMNHGDFEFESAVVSALAKLDARKFLLERLKLTPFGRENINAAIALAAYENDPQIKATAKALLDHAPKELSLYLETLL